MRKIFVVLAVAVFAVGIFLHNACAEEATILFTEGDVKIGYAASPGEWTDAIADAIVVAGDRLKTGEASWVELEIGKDTNNIVKLDENTTVDIIELVNVKIGLLDGEVRSSVESLAKDSTFEIVTPTAVCGARGTGWDTMREGDRVTVDAYENKVFMNRISEEGDVLEKAIITAGQRAVLEDRAQAIAMKDLPTDRVERWNSWKGNIAERRSAPAAMEKPQEKDKSAGMQAPPPPSEVDRIRTLEREAIKREMLEKSELPEKMDNVRPPIRERVRDKANTSGQKRDRRFIRRRLQNTKTATSNGT